jgi:hypothetical protein
MHLTRSQFGRPLCEFQGLLVEYCLRRSRGWMIAGGAVEMMQSRLAEIIFERRFSQRPARR